MDDFVLASPVFSEWIRGFLSSRTEKSFERRKLVKGRRSIFPFWSCRSSINERPTFFIFWSVLFSVWDDKTQTFPSVRTFVHVQNADAKTKYHKREKMEVCRHLASQCWPSVESQTLPSRFGQRVRCLYLYCLRARLFLRTHFTNIFLFWEESGERERKGQARGYFSS